MSYSKEDRAERARKAGLASAAKRKAAAEHHQTGGQDPVAPPPPQNDAEAERRGETVAPILDRSRVHPEPQAEPVPERPIVWSDNRRMASRTLEEAMAGGPAVEVDLSEPAAPLGDEEEAIDVLGTDMGAGAVHCAGKVMVPIAEVIRASASDVPGPGDRLVRYAGRPGLHLVRS